MAKYIESIECHEMVSLGPVTPKEVSSVIDMYSYYLREEKLEFHNIGKIVIIYSDKDDVISDGDVVQIVCNQKKPDGNYPWKLNRHEYLKNFYDRLIEYVLHEGWSISKFNHIFTKVADKKFTFDEIWKVKKWNSSRSAVARIEWNFSSIIDLYFSILYKDGRQKRYFISSLSPGLGVLDFCLGGLRWVDNNNVALVQSNKRDYWLLNLTNETVDFHYYRAESGDAHGQYDLGMMYASGSSFLNKDLQQSLHWLNKAAEKGFGRAIKQLKSLSASVT